MSEEKDEMCVWDTENGESETFEFTEEWVIDAWNSYDKKEDQPLMKPLNNKLPDNLKVDQPQVMEEYLIELMLDGKLEGSIRGKGKIITEEGVTEV